ncbi:MAG: tetratricopeptide repeat protein [Ignavibacteriales bacterium]|nr:tetratricopeptide repeat protein [Ignavibacteriales bacterium]
MQNEQRKLAAIMFTDMVGYSAMIQKNESLALALLKKQEELLHPIFQKYGGDEVKKTGDGYLVEYASALEAVNCAVEIQRTLHEYHSATEHETQFQIRIGIHIGDVVHRDGDVFGDGVNIAARVEPLAAAGGICITEDVFHQIQNRNEFKVVRLGKGQLKNINFPIGLYIIILPWDKKYSTSFARASFYFHKKKKLLLLVVFILLAIIISLLWKDRNTKIKLGDEKSIAVLPFKNLSVDVGNEYFSDGITEDIIAQLSKMSSVKVISRTSVMQYKNTNKNIRTIGEELGVTTILEGSIRREGNNIRIVAQLIDAGKDKHLWAETYDAKLENIFSIQSDVAQKIGIALRAQLSSDERVRIEKVATKNLEAYNEYLKGKYFWNIRNEESIRKSVTYFERAIQLDSSFAQAYTGLANAYIVLGDWGYTPSNTAYPIAKSAAMKALSLDSLSGEAHAVFAMVHFDYDWDWIEAEKEFLRAIELNPSYATAHQWYAEFLSHMKRYDDALREIRIAQQLDPLSLIVSTIEAYVHYYGRDYEKTIMQCKKTLEMNPNSYPSYFYLYLAYRQLGLYEEAVAARKIMIPDEGGSDEDIQTLEQSFRSKGSNGIIEWEYNFQTERAKKTFVDPYAFAILLARQNKVEEALDFLEKDFEIHSRYCVFLNMSPDLDNLRSHPRFIELMIKVGFLK